MESKKLLKTISILVIGFILGACSGFGPSNKPSSNDEDHPTPKPRAVTSDDCSEFDSTDPNKINDSYDNENNDPNNPECSRNIIIPERVPDIGENVPDIEKNVPDIEKNVPDIEENVPDIEENVPDIEKNVPDIEENVPDIEENAFEKLEKDYVPVNPWSQDQIETYMSYVKDIENLIRDGENPPSSWVEYAMALLVGMKAADEEYQLGLELQQRLKQGQLGFDEDYSLHSPQLQHNMESYKAQIQEIKELIETRIHEEGLPSWIEQSIEETKNFFEEQIKQPDEEWVLTANREREQLEEQRVALEEKNMALWVEGQDRLIIGRKDLIQEFIDEYEEETLLPKQELQRSKDLCYKSLDLLTSEDWQFLLEGVPDKRSAEHLDWVCNLKIGRLSDFLGTLKRNLRLNTESWRKNWGEIDTNARGEIEEDLQRYQDIKNKQLDQLTQKDWHFLNRAPDEWSDDTMRLAQLIQQQCDRMIERLSKRLSYIDTRMSQNQGFQDTLAPFIK